MLDLSVIWVPIMSLPWVGWWGVPQSGNSFIKLWFCQCLEVNPAHGPRSIWASWWAWKSARKTSRGGWSISLQHIQTLSDTRFVLLLLELTVWWKTQIPKTKSIYSNKKAGHKGNILSCVNQKPNKTWLFCFVEILREFDFIPFREVTVPLVQ